ncbi:MAG: formylglycine-generating enzyme family protein, partial [Clostridia bacterium]|nr:formylglycine-generating enzyme family protein [Clostridia bacterium]
EWQYACKAGSTGYRYGDIDEIAWYSGNSNGSIQEMGLKKPNSWGLYDMLGNIWEWCWDLYDESTYGSYRIFRGGSWAESERGCGATCRRRGHPSFGIDDLGFRLARNS